MTNFYTLQINWDAFSAIGSWFGAIATFSAAIIALYPYFKKVKLYFTLNSNIEPNPVLNIINSKSESIFIEEINFFAGPTIFKRCIFNDDFLLCSDELVSDKSNNFIEPFQNMKITFESARILHYMEHTGINIKSFLNTKLHIVVHTNIGKIKLKANIKTKNFIWYLISKTNTNITIENFMEEYCQ